MDVGWLEELIKKAKEHDLSSELSGDYALWNILSALRGPDGFFPNDVQNESLKLKTLTTARIRGILEIKDPGLYVRLRPLSPAEIEARDDLLTRHVYQQMNTTSQNTHFFQRFLRAMLALKQLGYDVPIAEKDSLIPLYKNIMGVSYMIEDDK